MRERIQKLIDYYTDIINNTEAPLQDRYVSCWGVLHYYSELKESPHKLISLTKYAQTLIPNRVECVYTLLTYIRDYGNTEDQQIAYEIGLEGLNEFPTEGLHLDKEIYNYKFFDELAILAYRMKDYDTYNLLIERILEDDKYPKEIDNSTYTKGFQKKW